MTFSTPHSALPTPHSPISSTPHAALPTPHSPISSTPHSALPTPHSPRIVIGGTIAIDHVKTPEAEAQNLLGGSAAYAALAASFFSRPVDLIGIIGHDFPAEHLEMLEARGVSLTGVERSENESFTWSGEYHANMNERTTHRVGLNVLESWSVKVPADSAASPIVVLANMSPDNQLEMLDQCGIECGIECGVRNSECGIKDNENGAHVSSTSSTPHSALPTPHSPISSTPHSALRTPHPLPFRTPHSPLRTHPESSSAAPSPSTTSKPLRPKPRTSSVVPPLTPPSPPHSSAGPSISSASSATISPRNT